MNTKKPKKIYRFKCEFPDCEIWREVPDTFYNRQKKFCGVKHNRKSGRFNSTNTLQERKIKSHLELLEPYK